MKKSLLPRRLTQLERFASARSQSEAARLEATAKLDRIRQAFIDYKEGRLDAESFEQRISVVLHIESWLYDLSPVQE